MLGKIIIIGISYISIVQSMTNISLSNLAQGLFQPLPALDYTTIKNTIESRIAYKQDLNMPTVSQNPPWYYVAYSNWPDLAALLIEHKTNTNAQLDSLNHTPLHIAAAHDAAATMDLLIKAGALVDLVDTHTRTPLMYACTFGKKNQCLSLLLKANANANHQTGNQYTPLMCLFDLCSNVKCSDTVYKNAIHLLCYYNADLRLKNSDNKDAQMCAREKGLVQLADYMTNYELNKQQLFAALLLDNIENLKKIMQIITVRTRDGFGNLPLYYALLIGDKDIIDLIIYADPYQLLETNQNHPLFLKAIITNMLQKYTVLGDILLS